MIVKVDGKALEWRVKVFQSQDPVALQEIHDGTDVHSESQKLFSLPTRTIAKNCNFRMIFADAYSEMSFARPAYAYANDPNFSHVSTSTKFWTEVVRKFFEKYKGMYQDGWNQINTVYQSGQIETASGRIYKFTYKTNRKGEPELPRTLILNYPIQGLAADLMMMARVILRKRLMARGFNLDEKVLLINTVHDDIELDLDNDPELIYNICVILEDVFIDLPKLFGQYYGVNFNIPLNGEVSYGHNLAELEEFKRENKIKI